MSPWSKGVFGARMCKERGDGFSPRLAVSGALPGSHPSGECAKTKNPCKSAPEIKRLLKESVVILSLLLLPVKTQSDQTTFLISGNYEASRYNPATREIYKDTHVRANFVATINNVSWHVAATNLEDGTVSEIWCVGTNSYTLRSYKRGNPATNYVAATVSRSSLYQASGEDFLHISLPWITYCLSPKMLESDSKVDLPAPWLRPRYRLESYGYRWLINASPGGMFIESCELVRDSSLDLSEEQEFLRPELVFPEHLRDYERYKVQLQIRKETPDGFIQGRYRCLDYWHGSAKDVPARAELTYYLPGSTGYSHPWFRGTIKAESIQIITNNVEIGHTPEETVNVIDFRYRKFNGRQLYRGALYTLLPGESWKPDNDPGLLHERAQYLKHAPRYNAFPETRKKLLLIWLFCALLLVWPVAAIFRKTKRKVT